MGLNFAIERPPAVRAGAAIAVLLAFVGCTVGDVELPNARRWNSPEPCEMAMPPPAPVVRTAADPAHCLPQAVRNRGADVLVRVSPDGRAIAVNDLIDLCLTVGPSGKVFTKHELSDGEKQCILADLREWRFAGIETCWPVFAYVHLGGRCER